MPLKTLFLNPPSFENYDGGASSRWPATREIESYWYPVWLAYPAGMLEGSRLLDASPHKVNAAETIQIGKEYEFLVLFTSTPGFQGDIKLAAAMKAANPKLKIAFVGPHVTTLPEASLKEGTALDFIVRREFDYATVEYANGKPLERNSGRLVSAAERDRSCTTPTVRRSPISMRCPTWSTSTSAISIPAATTCRSCFIPSFRCTPRAAARRNARSACGRRRLSGHPWRKRSSDAVAAEMAKAKEYWPWVKEFFFDDDTFNIQKARTIELCSKLKPLNLTWSCTSRVTTDYETLKAMKEAGCRLLIVGYESGDQQILKNIKKGATVERARDFTRDCKKLGLVVHGDFILGLPGETKETIRRTIDFAKELDVETIQVSLAHAYPGTELYDYAKANGFILNEGAQMVDEMGHQVAMIEYPGISRDYILEMVHRFYDEYYFRPKAIFRIVKRAAFNSTDRKRLYTEAKSFLKLRAARNRSVKETRKQQGSAMPPPPPAGTANTEAKSETAEPVSA